MVGAALAMAPLAWLLAGALERAVGSHGLRAQLVVGLVPVAGGVAVYGVLAWLLRIPEAAALFGVVRRRLSRAAEPRGPKE